jgi:hypothetical protein
MRGLQVGEFGAALLVRLGGSDDILPHLQLNSDARNGLMRLIEDRDPDS